MTKPQPPSHVVLVGEMGVGKTTVGRQVAKLLDRPHLDSDDLLTNEVGMTGRDYAELHGVEALHHLELRLFLDAVGSNEPVVLSPASSVIDHPAGREALLRHATVWLHATDATVRSRRDDDAHRRPVDDAEAARLRVRRLDAWREVSTLAIDTTSCDPRSCAAEIAAALETDHP